MTQEEKQQPKPRKKSKYISKEERRRQWGVRPLPPIHTQPEEKKDKEG